MTTNKHDRKEGRSANIGFAKWRGKCFYDSLVQGSSFVLQMNICAENPPLRKAENRSKNSISANEIPRLLPGFQPVVPPSLRQVNFGFRFIINVAGIPG